MILTRKQLAGNEQRPRHNVCEINPFSFLMSDMYSVDESLTPNDYTHLRIASGLSNFRGRIKMTANNSTSSDLASLTSGCWRLQ